MYIYSRCFDFAELRRRVYNGGCSMAQTSFEIDENTAAALDHLKKVYGVPSNAAVLKRALALALAASKYADSQHNIHIRSEVNGREQEVILPQRF
jgi:hypothetical protein